jgi:hypothetical protein
MVFEHLNDLFFRKNLVNNFAQLLQALSSHVVVIHIMLSIAWALGSSRLLILAKLFESIQPIAVREFQYWLVNITLCLLFHDAFFTHLLLHQFKVVVLGGCEVVVHNVQVVLDIHFN